MRLLLLAMIALLCLLQYRLWYADGSVVHRERLAAQLADQQAENDVLVARNSVLEAQVADLKSGSEAVEALARSELGLVKQGETFYHVVDPYEPAVVPDSAEGAAAVAPAAGLAESAPEQP